MEIKVKPSNYNTEINTKEILRNFFDFNWGSVATDVFNITESVDTKTFWLIFKSIRETNFYLTKKYGQNLLDAQIDLVLIAKQTESELIDYLSEEVKITAEFFTDALKHNNNYIIKAYNVFRKYCTTLEINLPDNIRLEYYYLFRSNLSNEFQDNKIYYQEVLDFFKNPVFEQNSSFGAIFEYNRKIKRFYTDKIQKDGEAQETLKDLYIDPFFKIFKNNFIPEILEEKKEARSYDFYYPENTISLHEFFNNFFFQNKKYHELKEDYDMIFLLGQPGQGKTSCCYKLVYDYLENNSDLPQNKIFFIKIRELVAVDFVLNPFQEISKRIPSNINLDEEAGYLILDGLDEAFMSGGITESNLRHLYDRLKKRKNRNLKIILTSRFSYLQINDPCLDNTLIIHLGKLKDEQILEYGEKFEKFYPQNNFGRKIEEIIKDEKYVHIKELLQQAVLTYFIGISNIDIEEKDSKAKIYDKIFDAMAMRSWDKSGQLDYLNSRMKDNPALYKKHLREYLCSLAFEIHQSPNLFISLGHLNSLDTTKTFVRKCFKEELLQSSENIKEINKYLLISFYFQESTKNDTNETAIEFFHNSLFEYLTAEYFWKENKKMLLNKDEDDDLLEVSYKNYFDLLDRLIGNKELSDSILYNLVEIIENENVEIKCGVLQQSRQVFIDLLEHDFLLKYNYDECLLTSLEKTNMLIKLFWTFIHTANKEMESIYVLPENIYKIFKSEMIEIDELYNVEIDNDRTIFFEDMFFYHAEVFKVNFLDCHIEFTILKSKIHFVNFKFVIFTDLNFRENVFEDVLFSECDFTTYKSLISENSFINCIFDSVEIPSFEWYEKFIDANNFDESTLNNHQVVSRLEKDYDNVEVTNYYIIRKN